MKKFKLLKDLPGIKAGAIYEYIPHPQPECQGLYHTTKSASFEIGEDANAFTKYTIKDHPDWFEEIKEDDIASRIKDIFDFTNEAVKLAAEVKKSKGLEFTKEDMIAFARYFSLHCVFSEEEEIFNRWNEANKE